MKQKLYILAFLLLIVVLGKAQNFQMTVKAGSTSNSVRVVIRPGATMTNAQMSSAQVTVLVPAFIGNPRPSASIRTNYITGMAYANFNSTEMAGGTSYYVYQFDGVGGATVPSTTYTAGVEYNLLEIQFLNRPEVTAQVRVAQLPNGGTGGDAPGQYNFYLAMNGVDVVNQGAQFYGSLSSNDGLGYTGYSFAALNGVVLPVNWLNFTAVRQGSDVALTWNVDNEENTSKYDAEVSVNGTDFTPIASQARSAGSGAKSYTYTDKQVAHYNSKVLHYRIKQYDKDGKFTYSPSKSIRLDMKGEISLFPNPAKEGFTLTVPYLNPNQQPVQLHLVNSIGQIVEQRSITKLAASNYYFSLQNSLVVSGDYLLKIYEDGQLTETKRVVVHK